MRREPNGSRSYWIHNKKGSEWELYLNESNGQIDIERISDEIHHYNQNVTVRFSNFVQFQHSSSIDHHWTHLFFVSYNCHIYIVFINREVIYCDITQTEEHNSQLIRPKIGRGNSFPFENPLIFKIYPMQNDLPLASHWMAYNRHDKSDRFRFRFELQLIESFDYELYKDRNDLPDIAFIRQMNDSLFSQIDSMIDYHWKRLTGHMIWFNIDHKHYYCFQSEGQPLSEEVLIYII